ncbi:leucine-rich repeat-containing protein 51 isoform X6 [Etheostoma spectabile]|uniref:leucine-rich repeat-containing protein 51 isoform X6 n=1 Tax=Etheostoma spectabile TaxID=54343 RepID=UPI0013AF19B5|nr:leucine-rich repeat-containing protein 51-like isoform X6 [Etheostoma spectabile]
MLYWKYVARQVQSDCNCKSHNVPGCFLGNALLSITKDAWTEEHNSGLRPLKRNSEKKYLSCSLRLNNNNISELHDLQKTVSHFLVEPSQLAWLDLSFNKISHIDQVLCELRDLRVLYLHGNSIYILSEVDRLGVLPHLHTITLHGNVIETNKAYRRWTSVL